MLAHIIRKEENELSRIRCEVASEIATRGNLESDHWNLALDGFRLANWFSIALDGSKKEESGWLFKLPSDQL